MPAIVQQASGTYTGAGPFSPTLPAASSGSNTVIVAIVGSATVATPSGFTLRTSQVNFLGHYLWDRTGGSAGYAFTPGASSNFNWWIAEIVGTGTFVSGSGQNNTATGTTYTTLTNTPTSGARLIIGSLACTPITTASLSTWTNSFTQQAQTQQSGGDFPLHGVGILEVTANGSTAYSTGVTFDASYTGRSALIASYTVPSGSAFSGTAATSGAGTLTGAGAPNHPRSAAVSGSGTVTGAGTPAITKAQALSSVGTLSAAGLQVRPGSSSSSGSGTLGVVASPEPTKTVPLSGSGTLGATGSKGGVPLSEYQLGAIEAPLTVEGVWDGTAVQPAEMSIYRVDFFGNMEGEGTLTAVGIPTSTVVRTTAASGEGTLSAVGVYTSSTTNVLGSAALSSAGTLTSVRTPAFAVNRPLSSTGTLSAVGSVVTVGVVPGWLRTSANTGIAAVGLVDANLTSYGTITNDLTITTPQYRKIFNMGTAQLILTGPTATLTECVVISARVANHGCVQLSGAGGQQLVNVDIRCTGGASGGEAIALKTWAEAKNTLYHSVKITGATIAFWHDSDLTVANGSVISECYAYDFLPETGNQQHRDGITRRNGRAPLLIRDSWIRMTEVGVGSFVTGALFLQPTNPENVVSNVTAQTCYFSGDGYNAYIQTTDNITVDNCRFRATEWGYKVTQGTQSNFVWTNNYLYANDPGNQYRGAQAF